jgi:transposase-like protein
MEGAEPRRWEKAFAERMQRLQEKNVRLEEELAATRGALQQARQQMELLREQLADAKSEVGKVQRQMADLSGAARPDCSPPSPPSPPAFVKANGVKEARRPPGRKAGHPAAHRMIPEKIDVHVEVPVPRDSSGCASCPRCHTQLSEVKKHDRVVEDLVPARRLVTCYHTTSGYCPSCRRRIESRDSQQPPAPPGVDLQQSQLGINSLSTAVLLRMQYRLPYRQVAQLFLDLPGLSISAGGVARQIQRMAAWQESKYDRLKALVRASPAVHMDETGWRIDGENHWLWTMLSGKATVYHMDKSRGGKVAKELLGENFTGTLTSDFYAGYGRIECGKQKCLVHLLRELRETAGKHPAFESGMFYRRCRRLVKEMLLLKKKKGSMPAGSYEARGRKLERRVVELARGPDEAGWKEPQAKRLAKRLKKHPEELTRFLWHEEVEGTNNAAERAIRPAVVARKISGGSRSEKGAKATAILMSVLRTAVQQEEPLLETIKTLLLANWAGENPALLTDILADPL